MIILRPLKGGITLPSRGVYHGFSYYNVLILHGEPPESKLDEWKAHHAKQV